MQENNNKIPDLKDLKEFLLNVPEKDQARVADISKQMMLHKAYGNPDYQWSPQDFELGAPLGRGSFGRVYVARERDTGFMVAMKIMFKSELEKRNRQRQIINEIEVQSRLKHPNILQMYTWFHDSERIYVVLELITGGDLYGYLKNAENQRFDEPRVAKYIHQVANALKFCHSLNIIHRDLKPENLLLTHDDNVKLCDFGWAVHASKRRETFCGTVPYIPPEMIARKPYGSCIDQWGLGILGFELLTGSVPFNSKEKEDVFQKIRHNDVNFPTYLSSGAMDLISKLLRKSSSERIPLINVIHHSWVVENKAIREAFLESQKDKKG